jgi:very-short-patch-repair endonuclease
MAAVLACGPGALLSHWDAAAIFNFLFPKSGAVHVSVPRGGGRKRRRGICIHRSSVLTAADETHRKNIPVTTPARTIADLRRVAPPHLVRRAIRQAELQGFCVDEDREPRRTRSDLEEKFLRLCRRHGLPRPEVNVQVGEFEVDFLWREHALVVETDSFRYHGTRSGFDSDRARDVRLKLLGFDVLRFTDSHLEDDPASIVSALRLLLD